MGGSLAFRKQIRGNLRRMQRELQLAGREDIDALVAAVRRSQRRVLDQLEETSQQLHALDAKLDRISQQLDRFMGVEDGAVGRGPAMATARRRKSGTRSRPEGREEPEQSHNRAAPIMGHVPALAKGVGGNA